jgi:hypothetical protein
VIDPAPEGAYQTIRYVSGSVGPLVYTIPNLTPGANCGIRLHFATFSDGSTKTVIGCLRPAGPA